MDNRALHGIHVGMDMVCQRGVCHVFMTWIGDWNHEQVR